MMKINNPYWEALQKAEKEDNPVKYELRAKYIEYAKNYLKNKEEVSKGKQRTLEGF